MFLFELNENTFRKELDAGIIMKNFNHAATLEAQRKANNGTMKI